MLQIGTRVRCKDPLMNRLHGEGVVYEVWDTEAILHHYQETGSTKRPLKNEVWYRILFDEAYEETPDEYDGNGELISAGGDNLLTLGEEEIEPLDTPENIGYNS
jgi:hypothetical protein